MSLLTDEEINALTIKRMIFHVVGGSWRSPCCSVKYHRLNMSIFFWRGLNLH